MSPGASAAGNPARRAGEPSGTDQATGWNFGEGLARARAGPNQYEDFRAWSSPGGSVEFAGKGSCLGPAA
eukprot:11173233-Lingulodinium_polyedra.AAC.1